MQVVAVVAGPDPAVPAGSDEDEVAGLDRRPAGLQVGDRHLLQRPALHLQADGRAMHAVEVQCVDGFAVADEVQRRIKVGAGVHGGGDAGHVDTALVDSDAALDLDRREQALAEHAVAVGLGNVDQHGGTPPSGGPGEALPAARPPDWRQSSAARSSTGTAWRPAAATARTASRARTAWRGPKPSPDSKCRVASLRPLP